MSEWQRNYEAMAKILGGENGEARETVEKFLSELEGSVEHAREEGAKLGERGFEATKQVATLSAGALVLIATFLSDIFPADMGLVVKTFVGAAVILLGLALISSVIYMNQYFGALVNVRSTADLDSNELPEYPELKGIKPQMLRLERYTKNAKILSETWWSLRRAYRWASTCFTLGILAFGTATLVNLFFG